MTKRQSKQEVRYVEIDPDPKGAKKVLGGANRDEWNDRLSNLLASALPVDLANVDESNRATAGAFAGLMDTRPADPVEGMLIAQMIVASEAALSMYRRGWQQPSEYFAARIKYLQMADKAARTVAVLAEKLNQHRGRGQQQIVVKHVTVNADQAVVTDQVVTGKLSSTGNTHLPERLLTASTDEAMSVLSNPEPVRAGGGSQKK